MRNIVATALLLSVLGSLTITASAEARPFWKTRVNHRQCRQEKRIYGGAQNGSLTGKEYRHVQAREARLAATEARFRRSGNGLSPAEAAKLENRQDALSKDIYHQKHDNQTR